VKTQRAETAEDTERDYNQEFRKLLLRHPKIWEPPLFGLLLRAEKIVGGEIWLVEDAIWEAIKNLGAQVSDEEKEYLKKLAADIKEKHTIIEALTTVERVARAFNPSADEGRIHTVISNEIKTSNLVETTPHIEVVNNPEPQKKHKPSLVSQTQSATEANIETLKKYMSLGIKLIPVYDDGAFISTGNPRDWETNDISEIQSLISGRGYRNGLGKGSKIKIFRFFPIDYDLVVIDIDMHTDKGDKLGKNGSMSWLKITANLNLPQTYDIMKHTCCVLTPSKGYHLYYKTEGTVELKKDLAAAVDIPKAVNVAGSVKAGKEYQLVGSLDTTPTLTDELKKLMLKPTKAKPIRRVSIPQNFSNGNKYLSEGELAAYKPFINEYLIAKGFQVNARRLINCPFDEHHNNGDKHPSAQVNQDFLYCFTAGRAYDIWGVAKQLNAWNFKAAVKDVVNTLGKKIK
jgi:hypothetical protein